MRKPEKRIRFRTMKAEYMIISILTGLPFVLLVSFIWFSLYRTQLWKSTTENAYKTLQIINNRFNQELEEVGYNMESLSINREFLRVLRNEPYQNLKEELADRRTMESLLHTASTQLDIDQKLYVITKEGKYFSQTGQHLSLESIEEYRDYIKEEPNNTIKIMTKQMNGKENEPQIVMMKLINKGRKSESILVYIIDCRSFLDSFVTNTDFISGLTIYHEEQGKVVYLKNLGEIGIQPEDAEALSHVQMRSNERNGIVKFREKEYLQTVYEAKKLKWILSVFIPKKDLTDQYMDGVITNIVIVIICLAVFLGMTYVASHLFTRNINHLSQAVERIDGTNMRLQIKITSHDEVEHLYNKFNEMLERLEKQMDIIRRNEKEKRSLEIKALQAQINPHFLYNTLNSIRFMAHIQGKENIYDMINALNFILHSNMSKESYHTLEEESEYLKNYISLKECQYATVIDLRMEMEPGIGSYLILKMLLQPIVENSIKHGKILDKPDGFIAVRFEKENDDLKITIKDNGIGMTEEFMNKMLQNLAESQEIGLNNIKERIRLMYGESYYVQISSVPDMYTIVEIYLPVIENGGKVSC